MENDQHHVVSFKPRGGGGGYGESSGCELKFLLPYRFHDRLTTSHKSIKIKEAASLLSEFEV